MLFLKHGVADNGLDIVVNQKFISCFLRMSSKLIRIGTASGPDPLEQFGSVVRFLSTAISSSLPLLTRYDTPRPPAPAAAANKHLHHNLFLASVSPVSLSPST